MSLLLFEGMVPAWTHHYFPDSPVAGWIGMQFTHVPWEGAHLWDLIQPAFIFMSGMAIPYAMASRRARGAGFARSFARVLRRALTLIALGLVIRSNDLPRVNFDFVHDVLLQIGLAYPFAWLIATGSVRTQVSAAAAILTGYWALFVFHPLPPPVDLAAAGIPADWTHFTGLFAHWNRYGNFAADFDRWFLNLFPRPQRFEYDELGLATLNFVPSIVTMVIGALAGQLIRRAGPPRDTLRRLAAAAVGCLATGYVLGQTLCPLVKPIWTPSWTLFSAGWALLALLVLYATIDVRQMKRWTYPFVVLGVNSLFVYLLLRLVSPWVSMTLTKLFGDAPYTVIVFATTALFWLAAAWLYKRRVVITA